MTLQLALLIMLLAAGALLLVALIIMVVYRRNRQPVNKREFYEELANSFEFDTTPYHDDTVIF